MGSYPCWSWMGGEATCEVSAPYVEPFSRGDEFRFHRRIDFGLPLLSPWWPHLLAVLTRWAHACSLQTLNGTSS